MTLRPNPRFPTRGAWALLALSSLLFPSLSRAADKQPAVFEVLLPADAELDVEGVKTRATGESRRFQSPPVETGSIYAYTVKATWHGRSVSRTIHIRPELVTQVDLRAELQAALAPPPPESFTLQTPAPLTVEAGKRVALMIHVQRDNFRKPIAVSFAGLPPHVKVVPEEPTIGPAETSWRGFVEAAPEAVAGSVPVKVSAAGAAARREAVLRLTIVRPAPPAASFRLSAPLPVTVQRGQEVSVVLTVQRDHFKGPVKLSFGGLPPGVRILGDGVAAGMEQGRFTVKATKEATTGPRQVTVVASGGGHTEEAQLRLTVELAPAPSALEIAAPATKAVKVAQPVKAPPAQPELALVLPEGLAVDAGRTGFVEVGVLAKGTAALPAEPTVTLTPPPGVKLTPWSASDFMADARTYSRGYSVRTAADAPVGEALVRVRATVAGRSAEGTFKVTIRKPPAPPPAPELQLVLPEGVAVEPGRTALVEVRVVPKGAAALLAEPTVTLTPPAGGKIKLTPWSASDFKASPDACTRGYVLRAAPQASPGELEVRVRVTAAGRVSEGSFKVTVRKSTP